MGYFFHRLPPANTTYNMVVSSGMMTSSSADSDVWGPPSRDGNVQGKLRSPNHNVVPLVVQGYPSPDPRLRVRSSALHTDSFVTGSGDLSSGGAGVGALA